METAVERLNQFLEEARQELKAKSCTFYVADPYWPTEYRLVCMPGVRFPESMYGFITPDARTRRRICEGPHELFCTELGDAQANKLPPSIPADRRYLFWDFSAREEVKCYARLRSPNSDGIVEAILFVNFGHQAAFEDPLRRHIRGVNDACRNMIPEVRQELLLADARPLAESVKILQPVQAFVRRWTPPFEKQELSAQFARIIERSIKALEIDSAEAFGTIHLYDPGAGILRLAAHFGIEDQGISNAPREQNVLQGAGVISWVVLRQRSLLINDLRTSEFRRIQVEVDANVVSELAVPMIANGELVGVINLECRRANAFSPASVRSIWYAAESAALVYQSWRDGRTNWALGNCTAEAIKGGQQTRTALDKLAIVLAESMGADLCDLWHYNLERDHLEFVGASYPPIKPGIRPDGWSNFVRRTKEIVWISGIQERGLATTVWRDGEWQTVADSRAPKSVNDNSVAIGVSAEMGMPILVTGSCIAVAWLKYKRPRVQPGPELLDEARLWANQAGIVVESVQRQLEAPEREQLHRVAKSLEAYWNTGELDFGSHVPIEGYAYHRPFHGPACGDFHAVTVISHTAAGVLIGDARGHAVSGLINALPLIATFNSFSHDAASTRYMMEKLMTAATTLGVQGTAVYCTFSVIQQDQGGIRIYLSATSAGHLRLILLRRAELWNYELFPKNHFALGTGLGYVQVKDVKIKLPFGEDQTDFEPGDILIAITDGISDAFLENEQSRDHPGEDVGLGMSVWVEPIVHAARSRASKSCQAIAEAIVEAAERASPGFSDDATVCVVRAKRRPFNDGNVQLSK